MPISFPSSPNVNDQHTTGGRVYRWNGDAWELAGSGIAGPTGATGPTGDAASIAAGSVGGDILQWDGNAATWVATAPAFFPSVGNGNADGEIIAWDNANSVWAITGPVSGGGGASLPAGSAEGDVIRWDNTATTWVATGPRFLPDGATDGAILSWDNTNATWVVTGPVPAGQSFPTGSADGQILAYDNNGATWIATGPITAASILPTGYAYGDVLSWINSAWSPVSASTPGLPSATQYDLLVYDGTNWVSEPLYGGSYSPLGTGSAGDVLKWSNGAWYAAAPFPAYNAQTSYNVGDIVAYSNTIWRATSSGMGNTPQYGSGYWENLSLIDLDYIPKPASPSDGNVLTYNAGSAAWVAQAPAGGGGATYQINRATSDTTTDSNAPGEALLQLSITPGTWTLSGLLIAYDWSGSGETTVGASVTAVNGSVINGAFNVTNASDLTARPSISDFQWIAFSNDSSQPKYITFSALIICTNESGDTLLLNIGDYAGVDRTVAMGEGTYMVATKVS